MAALPKRSENSRLATEVEEKERKKESKGGREGRAVSGETLRELHWMSGKSNPRIKAT